ncbi:hypothetical protein SBD_7432 [Streptomyces bottropensis ATCC 25435]|uniref:Uncharacterized protein n=1 Tax=Streptomyces bottropensis ATCC 25435 TaxID=1054862 RepID=M3FFH4_9ACTN|nr:hypothetical protein SBD_7432 [Streptomyces bottropensis ATCC 25435]
MTGPPPPPVGLSRPRLGCTHVLLNASYVPTGRHADTGRYGGTGRPRHHETSEPTGRTRSRARPVSHRRSSRLFASY